MMFPPRQERDSNPTSPSHPRPALGLGHGGRDWLQITPKIFLFFPQHIYP